MTADDFRRIACNMPGASEDAHMGHPDFRVHGKIFATLGCPDNGYGMVKLTPEQQQEVIQNEPGIFAPIKGGWGRQGCTQVRLQAATEEAVGHAMTMACRNVAVKALAVRTKRPKTTTA
jgi:hypothetical protein